MNELFNAFKQRGFTLVEVMLSVAISSVVALVVAKVMESGTKEYKRIEARSSVNNVHQTIVKTLQDEVSCSVSLRDTMPAEGVLAGSTGIEIGSVKRCNVIDFDVNGVVTCNASDILTLFQTGQSYANNSITITSMLYKDDVANGGPRVEVTYDIKGTSGQVDGQSRVAGISQVKKESILLKINYSDTGIFSCETDITNMINAAVENSCKGNNAYLDKTQDKWKCYHEMDLPVCPAGSAIVAVISSSDEQNAGSFGFWQLGDLSGGVTGNVNADSKRINPSLVYDDSNEINRNAVTFKCMDISPAGCVSGNFNVLALTVVTGGGDYSSDPTKFYNTECVYVENCYFAPNEMLLAGRPRYLTYNQTDKRFKCVEKKCSGENQIAVTTEFGEKCVNCAAGSILIKIADDPGFMCSNQGCDDSKASGTSLTATENVQQYFTGGWDATGNPICRDLLTSEAYCESGGTLKVASDGSVRWECCPECDARFSSERANVCFGQSFTAANGCTICEGTKDLQSGCEEPTLYCPGTDMGTSECGQACAPGTRPVNQGTLSAWSEWSTCTAMNGSKTGSYRTRTCDGATCGGNCNGAILSETKPCNLYDVDSDGGNVKSFANCQGSGGEVVYVSRTGDTNCINSSDAILKQYVNSATPQCVPVCFFDVTPTGIRGEGVPESYTNQGCSYNEVTSSTFLKDCPTGYTRFKGFSSATQTATCPCCETNIGGCSLNTATCTDGGPSYPGWSYVNRQTFAGTIGGADKKSYPGSGGSCWVNTIGFTCFPTLTKVGCGY